MFPLKAAAIFQQHLHLALFCSASCLLKPKRAHTNDMASLSVAALPELPPAAVSPTFELLSLSELNWARMVNKIA